MRSERMIRAALRDVEETLRGKQDDPREPLWERRARRLWNYGFWDVDLKTHTKSHMPTAIKILRWILEEGCI